MSRRVPIAIGTALAVAVGCGIGIAVDRGGGGVSDQTEVVAALSVADRTALAADRKLIASLPAAIAEVPQAAADAAETDVATARADLAGVTALRPLVAAIDGHFSAVTLLVSSYQALLDGTAPADEASVPQALTTLQSIEGDIIPAVRVVALHQHRQLGAADAFAVVVRDPAATALGRVLAEWSQIYGAFLLMEQEALS
ncbi:MAG TPA: hypothetical protein VHW74_11805 [Mycobacteriales bacterium]|nr:hypothetical protein [Mycobacteriales bacterium]